MTKGNGSYYNFVDIAMNLELTNITIQETNNIDIVDDSDLSTSPFGTPKNHLSLVAPVFNLNANLNMSTSSNLILTADTINMSDQITSGGSLMDSSRIINTATQINVLANTASIQQAIDIASDTLPATTVNVSAGNYDESLNINKALTLRGALGILGADINAPALSGVSAGGDIITVSADNVTIEGFYFNALVDGGLLANSVNAVAAGAVTGLSVSYNTLNGFASTGFSVPDDAVLTANVFVNANAGPDLEGYVEETLTFDGSRSSDSEGVIVSYDWDFGDGTVDSGIIAIHAYSIAGTYTVTLTVTNDQGLTGTDTSQVVISEVLDQDGDGVPDNLDQCPNTPAGEVVDAVGCSGTQLDDDNDGVDNVIDQCPTTPAGAVVDANGCSASQLDVST